MAINTFNPFEEIIESLNFIKQHIPTSSNSSLAPVIEIIGREELCKRLSVSEPTIIRWERKGKIPCFRIGSAIRYDWYKVVASLEKGNS